MKSIQARLTVFRLILAISIVAIVLTLLVNQAREIAERRLEIADNHARIGAEYRQNSVNDPMRIRIASWHDLMRDQFEAAAHRPWASTPVSRSSPPPGWQPPAEAGIAIAP